MSQEESNYGSSHKFNVESGKTAGKGWFVTYPIAFGLLLAAMAAILLVGLAVGLGHPDRNKKCPPLPEHTALPPTAMPSTTSKTSTEMPTAAPVDIRLPDNLIPYDYYVRLRPDFYGTDPSTFKFTGAVDIYMDCKKATNTITVHYRKLAIDKASIKVTSVSDSSEKLVDDVTMDEKSEFYNIHLKSELVVGQKYKAHMTFGGNITDDLAGIYYSSYTVGTTKKYLLTSQLQPVDARKVFPCFDEPHLKATFKVSLERKKSSGYTCMSNSIITSTEDVDGDWAVDHFDSTPPMSSYLLAFTISDFQCYTNYTKDGKKVDVCARPNAMDQTVFATSLAANVQDWYEWYHNISYPLNKTAHIAVPDFSAGAMENWGIIIYRETALLYDPSSSTASQRQRVAVVVSHELAHMWFGNLVTMLWWDDIWLNEGFASYMELRGIHSQLPSWNMDADFVVNDLHGVMTLDALPTSHPVYLEVNDPAEISQLFDTITYSKGSSVIRMMRNFLGEETFRWGISNYLKDRAYNSASYADLFNSLTEQAETDGKSINVTQVMQTWILQLGYPVVTFTYDKTQGKIMLKQEHYLLDPSSRDKVPPSPYNYVWKVPLTYATDTSTANEWENATLTWLNNKTGEITSVPTTAKWVIGNMEESFYYRVNYDDDNWQALKKQLTDNHTAISLISRCQLVDDAFNLGRANILNQTVALEISSYLKRETELFPWRAFSRNIAYMSQMLVVTGAYGDLTRYIQDMVNSSYSETLWTNKPSSDVTEHVQSVKRTLILTIACSYGLRACKDKAVEKFKDWQAAAQTGMSNPIEADLRPVVYCTGLSEGGEDEWTFAFSQFVNTSSGAEAQTLLRALGCTGVDWLLRRYMDEAFSEVNIRRQDFRSVLSAVAGNSIGRNIAWQSFAENWDLLYERFGITQFSFANIVDYVTYQMNTKYEYELVKAFMAAHPEQGTGATAFKQALDKINANIVWRATHEKSMAAWLKAYSSSLTP